MRLTRCPRRAFAALLVLAAAPLVAARADASPWALDTAAVGPRIDQVFSAFDEPDSPGCAVLVARDGKVLHERGYGMANLEHGTRIGSQTVFDIGSTSKQFTAMSVLLLAQDGKLGLDDDVRKHVPELPDYGRTVTIRHLIHHTSGIRDYLGLMDLAGWRFEDVATDQDALDVITRQKALNFDPGTEHLYSNSGYFLLSMVVERASGRSLPQFAAERIFRPLGMKDTHFHDDHTQIVPNRATGYSPRKDGGFRIEMSNFEQTGDGSLYTTVRDMNLWDRNFYEGTVGGRELLQQMVQPAQLASGRTLDYAFGLVLDEHKGLEVVGHGGAWAGYRADLIRFPAQHASVVCLCNLATANPSALARRVADVVLADAIAAGGGGHPDASEPPDKASAKGPVRVRRTELEQKAGTYRDPVTGTLRDLSFRHGRLEVDVFGGTYELQPFSPTLFRLMDAPGEMDITFDPPAPGRRLSFHEAMPGRDPVLREAIDPTEPSARQLAEYAGAYESDELRARFELVVNEGHLAVRARNTPEMPLRPAVADEFTASGLVIRFDRGAAGDVTGFGLDAGRIRNLRFTRKLEAAGTAGVSTP